MYLSLLCFSIPQDWWFMVTSKDSTYKCSLSGGCTILGIMTDRCVQIMNINNLANKSISLDNKISHWFTSQLIFMYTGSLTIQIVLKCFTECPNLPSEQASVLWKNFFFCFFGMYLLWLFFPFNRVLGSNVRIIVRHRHALKKYIYTCIFGITCSPVAGLMGCQKHLSSHLTSELLFQKHSPARHNMPPSINSHLFPSSMGLYGPFSSHKTTFVHHAAFLLFFALKVFDVCTFPLECPYKPNSS